MQSRQRFLIMAGLRNVTDMPKGAVGPNAFKQRFRLNRHYPRAELAGVLDHHWIVEWDLRDQPPFVQRTLPYPCVNQVHFTRDFRKLVGKAPAEYRWEDRQG